MATPVDEPKGVDAEGELLKGKAVPKTPDFEIPNGEADGAAVLEPKGDNDEVFIAPLVDEKGDGEELLAANDPD